MTNTPFLSPFRRFPMSVSYDYYRIFYYVAKYGSFTRAASILMNSQPNITRTIANLEKELDCRLFLRTNRGVTLTPEGKKLFAHVEIAHEQLQNGELELASEKNLQTGSISIGVSETALQAVLLPVLQRFRRRYPGVRFRITNHSTAQAVASLKSGLVELALVSSPTGATKPLKEFRLTEFRDVLIAGPHFRRLTAGPQSLKDLASFPLICLGPQTKTYHLLNDFFTAHDQSLQPDIIASTTEQILPMVKNDLGLGFLPEKFADEAIKKGEVFSIDLKEKLPLRHICLIRDKSRSIGIAARELEKMCLQFREEIQE